MSGKERFDESWQPIGASQGPTGVNWQILFGRRTEDGNWEYRIERYDPLSTGNSIETAARSNTGNEQEQST